MVSVCLPSDALLQHLPSYLGFSCGVSLDGCSSKAQSLFLTLDEGYLLITALSDLQRGIAPLGPPAPAQPRLLGRGVAPPGCRPWPRTWGNSSRRHPWPRTWGNSSSRRPWPRTRGSSSWPPPFGHGVLPASAPDLRREVTPLGRALVRPSQSPALYIINYI